MEFAPPMIRSRPTTANSTTSRRRTSGDSFSSPRMLVETRMASYYRGIYSKSPPPIPKRSARRSILPHEELSLRLSQYLEASQLPEAPPLPPYPHPSFRLQPPPPPPAKEIPLALLKPAVAEPEEQCERYSSYNRQPEPEAVKIERQKAGGASPHIPDIQNIQSPSNGPGPAVRDDALGEVSPRSSFESALMASIYSDRASNSNTTTVTSISSPLVSPTTASFAKLCSPEPLQSFKNTSAFQPESITKALNDVSKPTKKEFAMAPVTNLESSPKSAKKLSRRQSLIRGLSEPFTSFRKGKAKHVEEEVPSMPDLTSLQQILPTLKLKELESPRKNGKLQKKNHSPKPSSGTSFTPALKAKPYADTAPAPPPITITSLKQDYPHLTLGELVFLSKNPRARAALEARNPTKPTSQARPSSQSRPATATTRPQSSYQKTAKTLTDIYAQLTPGELTFVRNRPDAVSVLDGSSSKTRSKSKSRSASIRFSKPPLESAAPSPTIALLPRHSRPSDSPVTNTNLILRPQTPRPALYPSRSATHVNLDKPLPPTPSKSRTPSVRLRRLSSRLSIHSNASSRRLSLNSREFGISAPDLAPPMPPIPLWIRPQMPRPAVETGSPSRPQSQFNSPAYEPDDELVIAREEHGGVEYECVEGCVLGLGHMREYDMEARTLQDGNFDGLLY